jgi:hypothetical protein
MNPQISDMNHTVVSKWGPLTMQICTDHEDLGDAVVDINLAEPAGTSSGWTQVADDDPCLNDAPPVVDCAKYPGRRHFVVEC